MTFIRDIAEARRTKAAGGVGPGLHTAVGRLLQNQARGKLLDALASTGKLSRQLKDVGYDVDACDLFPEHFEPEDIVCHRADLNKPMPFETDSYDTVVLIEAIEHLENPWLLIREAHRILTEGGVLILSFPNILSTFSRFICFVTGHPLRFSAKEFQKPAHINPISLTEVELIFREVGFEVEKTAGAGYRLPIIADRLLSLLQWAAYIPTYLLLRALVAVTKQNMPAYNALLKDPLVRRAQNIVIKARRI